MLKVERTDAVMILTLDRPEARNALNLDLTDACTAAAAQINAELSAAGGEALAVPANIGRLEELRNLVDIATAKWGAGRRQKKQARMSAPVRRGANEGQLLCGIALSSSCPP
jgi:enoyl-CoA hydratase/carnithine racemase